MLANNLVGRSLMGGLGNNLSGLSSTSYEMTCSNFLSQVLSIVKLIDPVLLDMNLVCTDVIKCSILFVDI